MNCVNSDLEATEPFSCWQRAQVSIHLYLGSTIHNYSSIIFHCPSFFLFCSSAFFICSLYADHTNLLLILPDVSLSVCLPSQVRLPLLSLHPAPDKATDVSPGRWHPPFEDVCNPWPPMCQGSYSSWGWTLTLVKTPLLPCSATIWRRIPGPPFHPLQENSQNLHISGTGGHSSEGSCLANKLKPFFFVCFFLKQKQKNKLDRGTSVLGFSYFGMKLIMGLS